MIEKLYHGKTVDVLKQAETKACIAVHNLKPKSLGHYLIRVDISNVKERVEQYNATTIPEGSLYVGYVVYFKHRGGPTTANPNAPTYSDFHIRKAYKLDGKYYYNAAEIGADDLLRILTFGDDGLEEDVMSQDAGITEEGLEAVIADLKK